MNGLTNYITEMDWIDIITCWYVWVDEGYQELLEQQGRRLRQRGPEPEVSDSEIITMGLIIETWFQGHEEVGYSFIQQFLRPLFPRQLDLDRFNHRRRQLIGVTEALRRRYRDRLLDRKDGLRLVDSAPITLMTYPRGSHCESVRGPEYFGVVTSKKTRIFGLRLHTTVTIDQLIDEWMLAPASIHDTTALDALLEGCTDLQVVGDKAYNDAELEERLWRKRRIQLLPLRKHNQHQQWPAETQRILGMIRHRIETVFSTLTTTFNLQRPRGRSLSGHVVRIATCILAHTFSFMFNELVSQNP
jgi:hypothetical protein